MLMVWVALAVAGAALAGPDWIEGGENDGDFLPDAGPLPDSSQPVPIPGPLGSLTGSLKGAAPITEAGLGLPPDFEDMYLVRVDDFAQFFVSTESPPLLTATEGVPQAATATLYLFTGPDHPAGPGLGLLANQQCPTCQQSGGATLTGTPTDGSPIDNLIPGLRYFLAISGDGRFPVDALGRPIFAFSPTNPFEVSGPDGAGGGSPIAGWAGPGVAGQYILRQISGVSGARHPPDLNGDGRVNGADITFVLNVFGAIANLADLNGDGVVNGPDISLILNAWTG
ncbi:MAG: hypothetical protein D6693_09430 [Planctomycetota bacterium]|nr:MAG: hypothetical protein D6693_09430 [Planctomycetota bacterium]